MSVNCSGMYQYPQYGMNQYSQYRMNPMMRESIQTPQGITKNAVCGAADDGKIDSSTAIHEYFGGMVDCVKSMLKPKGILATVAVGAACLAFPPLGGIIATAGAVLAGIGLGYSIIKGATAKTDQDKMDAYRQAGASTFGLVASFAGKLFKPLCTKKVAANAKVRMADKNVIKAKEDVDVIQKKVDVVKTKADVAQKKVDNLEKQNAKNADLDAAKDARDKANAELKEVTGATETKLNDANQAKTNAELERDVAHWSVKDLKDEKTGKWTPEALKPAEKSESIEEFGARFNETLWNKDHKLSNLQNWSKVGLYTGALAGNYQQMIGTEDKAFEDPRLRYYQQGMMGGYGMNDQYGFKTFSFNSFNDLRDIYNSTNSFSLT